MGTLTTLDRPPVSRTPVDGKLRGAWQRERWFVHLRGLAPLVFVCVALFLLSFLFDWLFEFPYVVRLLLVAVNVLAIGTVCWIAWWRHLRRYDPLCVALQVERLHPNLNSLLVSYVQFNGAAKSRPHGSPQMIEMVRVQAERSATPLDFRGIVSFAALRTLLAGAALAAVLFGVSTLFVGRYYRIFLARLLPSGIDTYYPRNTQLTAVTGNQTIRLGDSLTLSATAEGTVPGRGTLLVRFGKGPEEKIDLGHDDHDVFTHQFAKPSQDFSYSFRIGDARQEKYQVTVVPPPRIVSGRVRLNFPAYTGRPSEEQDRLDLAKVLEGTTATWTVECDRPLKSAKLLALADGAEFKMDVDDTKKIATTTLNVNKLLGRTSLEGTRRSVRAFYQFKWTDEYGFQFTDNTRYLVEIEPDKPPTVVLLKPRLIGVDKMLATVNLKQPLLFEASDDYGLQKAFLYYRVNGGSEQKLSIGKFDGSKRCKPVTYVWDLKEAIPNLKEGDKITLAIGASDNREGRPNVGRSVELTMAIVDRETYLASIRSRKEQGGQRIEEVTQDEIKSSGTLEQLTTPKGERP